MEGNEEVIQVLQDVLCAELTAVNQYFIHARMCENWGYKKLAAYIRKESIEEMQHAQEIIDRILYFDGAPNLVRERETRRIVSMVDDVDETILFLDDLLEACRSLDGGGWENVIAIFHFNHSGRSFAYPEYSSTACFSTNTVSGFTLGSARRIETEVRKSQRKGHPGSKDKRVG